jgi:phosphoglycerate dehydrogenase-like enzyme
MRIATTSRVWNDELAKLLAPGLSLTLLPKDDEAARAQILADAEVLVSPVFTAEMGQACKRLRLIVCPAAGTESIDRTALPPGVKLVNGVGHEIPMAEYVIGCLVALRQRLLQGDAALRKGDWQHGFWAGLTVPLHNPEELYGSKLGMVGFGRIALEIQKRAEAFGMTCAAVTLHPEKPREEARRLEFIGALAEAVDVDRLVGWCDALVLCCELSPLTQGLLDGRRLALMKRNSVVINVARGPIAVEKDLYQALASKTIAAAAIDVWYEYPQSPGEVKMPASFPFHTLDNVIMSPHSSGWTEAAKQRRLAAMARAINDFARAQAQA